MEKGEHVYPVGGNADGAATVENSMEIPQLKMDLPYDPAIPLLGIYPNKPETLIQKIYKYATLCLLQCYLQ